MHPELERLLFLKGRSRLPNVLLVAAECAPLSKTGGLADMAGALPGALQSLGFDARVITPYHRCIKEKYADRVEHMTWFYVDLGWRHEYAGLERLRLGDLTVYLIDSEYYFGDKIYRGGSGEVEQYAFFQRAVIDAIPKLDFEPEVLHCNDWHTAMLPFLVKAQYGWLPQGALKTILTIHNLAFQGWLSFDSAGDLLAVDSRWFGDDGLGHNGSANFLKAGCLFADKVNTVSPSYANEIRTPEFGEGLQDVLLRRGADVSGVLNGLDTVTFDPASDPNIPFHYSADQPEDKVKNKVSLLREMNLTVATDTPLVAMVTRMTAQKGFDLVMQVLDALMERDVAFLLLGTGDSAYENAMREYENRYRGRVCAYIGYSEPLAHRIYAGADFLLMPSAFEPCGLSQMIAMRYGTLPIVHEVGGLRDTVTPYNQETGAGDGFSFYDYNPETLLKILNYALDTYYNKEAMGKLVYSAMTRDVSLNGTAVEYGKLYLTILNQVKTPLHHIPWDETYRVPFGAVTCGTEVTIRLAAEHFNGGASLLIGGETLPMTRDADGLFSAVYTAPDTPGAVYYGFLLDNGVFFGIDGVGVQTMRPWLLTVYRPQFAVPTWAEGTVIYQIFPDRFAQEGNAAETGVEYHRGLGRNVELHKSWDDPVKYRPSTGSDYYPDDFYGGTLKGIETSLQELKERGVGCIYLNPIFESDSNHRFNTADYHKIDPILGTEQDFRSLCSRAKELGIRVLLDGAFAYTGDDSVYFNRPWHYPEPGACQEENSPWYTWYDFRAFPDDYNSWGDSPTLPVVRQTDPGWQSFLIHGENAVVKRWLREGADGWQLEVSDALRDEVIDGIRQSVKAENPEALLLGEVREEAAYGISSIALRDGLDSVSNDPLRSFILRFALGEIDAYGLRDFLLQQKLNYPAPMYRCLMNHLGNHDTARLRTVLGSGWDGDMRREDQAAFTLTAEQNARGRGLQRLCAALQFALPGMPCLYYGDEEGMQGLRDPFCRAPLRVAEEGESLRDFYAGLARERNENEVLRRGDAAFAACGWDVVAVLRYSKGHAFLLAINRGDAPVTITPKKEEFLGLSRADAAGLADLPTLKLPGLGFVRVTL